MTSLYSRVLEAARADLLVTFRLVRTTAGPAATDICVFGERPTERPRSFVAHPELAGLMMNRNYLELGAGAQLEIFPQIYAVEKRRIFFCQRSVSGCISLFYRTAPQKTRKSRAWLELEPELEKVMRRNPRAEEAMCGKLVIDAAGKIEASTPEIAVAATRLPLSGALLEAESSGFLRPVLLGGTELKIVPLAAAEKRLYLVELSPAPPLELAPIVWLTPKQQEVALQAAAGATAQEISRSIHSGVETVRVHLREIYKKLGVASRLELAQTLEGARNYT